MRIHPTNIAVTFLCVLTLFLSCHEASNIATGGSQLFLSADPPSIGFNETSTLTVSGTDDKGMPLPNGTKVAFQVNEAGTVKPSTVELENGTATSRYFSTFVSGNITITATSGSVAANTTVTVADNVQRNVFVSANPATFATGGGTSQISAIVTDDSGKPIVGLGVTFTTTTGTLQSGGANIKTDSNGLASDTLVTNQTATVTATTDDGFSGQTTVEVGVGLIICHMSVSTSSPKVGQAVSFFDTSNDPGKQIVRYHWDFGDASSADGQNVQHPYGTAGTFDVVHSVIDSRGNTTFCSPVSIQVSN